MWKAAPPPTTAGSCGFRHSALLGYTAWVVLSDTRLISALTLRAHVGLKRELQRLCRVHDAAAAFLWLAAANGDSSFGIEFAGDHGALPRSQSMQGRCTHVCEQRTLRSLDGDDREVVLLYSRMCKDAPTLLLGLVDPATPFTDILTDDMEGAAETLETMILNVLEPVPIAAERVARSARR